MVNVRFSETEAQAFLRIIRDMPPNMAYGIAHKYGIKVPMEVRLSKLPSFLFDKLDPKTRKEIIYDYADAGKPICHFFRFDTKVPTLNQLMDKSDALFSLKDKDADEKILTQVPYFEKSEIHHPTRSLRVRFRYYRTRIPIFDPETQTMKEYYPISSGVVIFTPERKLVQVRAKNRSVSKSAVISYSVALGLKPAYSLNLYSEAYVQRFLNWINSLNNARFEFDVRRVLSSISLSTRGRTDLREVDDFKKYLEEGTLRGGHATIITEEKHQIRFRIFFRDCRTHFTRFSSENNIGVVSEALEKILEGYRFDTHDKMLDEFFE